jgi:hypothetical protein
MFEPERVLSRTIVGGISHPVGLSVPVLIFETSVNPKNGLPGVYVFNVEVVNDWAISGRSLNGRAGQNHTDTDRDVCKSFWGRGFRLVRSKKLHNGQASYVCGNAFPAVLQVEGHAEVIPGSDWGHFHHINADQWTRIGISRIKRLLHDVQLAPENAGGDPSQYSGEPRPQSRSAGPVAYAMGQWIIGLLILAAVVCGIAVNYVDDRWPHAAWIPLAVFAILSVVACFQLSRLANEMGGRSDSYENRSIKVASIADFPHGEMLA